MAPEVLALLQKYDKAALEKMARQQQKQHEKNEEKRRKQDERERQARERAQRLALRPSQQNVDYASFDTPQVSSFSFMCDVYAHSCTAIFLCPSHAPIVANVFFHTNLSVFPASSCTLWTSVTLYAWCYHCSVVC